MRKGNARRAPNSPWRWELGGGQGHGLLDQRHHCQKPRTKKFVVQGIVTANVTVSPAATRNLSAVATGGSNASAAMVWLPETK